jgi:RNA polymerase sigma factor (sigma-70 family)
MDEQRKVSITGFRSEGANIPATFNPEAFVTGGASVESDARLNSPPTAAINLSNNSGPSDSVDWAPLVDRIRRGDQSALEELYAHLAKGVRFFFLRRLGPGHLDDRTHDVFLTIAAAIRNGELREPARLMGYVRTVVRRTIAGAIQKNANSRARHVDLDQDTLSIAEWRLNPEQTVIYRERAEVIGKMLNCVSSRDREVLRRFYVEEESEERICEEMRLTNTQFRLLKSRAKARFIEKGQRVVQKVGPWREDTRSAQPEQVDNLWRLDSRAG